MQQQKLEPELEFLQEQELGAELELEKAGVTPSQCAMLRRTITRAALNLRVLEGEPGAMAEVVVSIQWPRANCACSESAGTKRSRATLELDCRAFLKAVEDARPEMELLMLVNMLAEVEYGC